MQPLRFNPFDSKNTQRFVYFEGEPDSMGTKDQFERLMRKVEGRTAAEVMTNFMAEVKKESGGEDLDDKTKSYLADIEATLTELYYQNQEDVAGAMTASAGAKRRIIDEIKPKLAGEVETMAELAVRVEEAAILVQAAKYEQSFYVAIVDKAKNPGNPEDPNNRARDFDPGAYEKIELAAIAKWTTSMEDAMVKRMMKTAQGREMIAKKKVELDNFIFAQIHEATSGFLGWKTSVTSGEADDIAKAIGGYKTLDNDSEFRNLAKQLGLDIPAGGEDKRIEEMRKEVKKAVWIDFARRLESGNAAWKTVSLEETPTIEEPGRDEKMMQAISISRIQNEIVRDMDITDPSFCKIGNAIFVHGMAGGQEAWRRADLDKMKNPTATSPTFEVSAIFKPSDRDEYLVALGESENMDKEVLQDIKDILKDHNELTRRVGERISIQKELEAFDREKLMQWTAGSAPPKEIEEQISTALGAEFKKTIELYKLNFLEEDIIKKAREVKMKAIMETFKGMDMPSIILGIDRECRNLSQEAEPVQEYKPYEKFKIAIFPSGIRVVPDGMKDAHASLFRGATLDSVREDVKRKLELEGIKNIPFFGPILALFLSDADPKTAKMITGICAMFGMKAPSMGAEMLEKINKETEKQMQQIEARYETLYPTIKNDDFEKEVVAVDGLQTRKEGTSSVMLESDTRKFTGVMVIPPGETLRSIQQLNVKTKKVSNAEGIDDGVAAVKTQTDNETRENFYATNSEYLLVYCKDVILKKHSNLPVGLRILEAQFQSVEEEF